MKLNFTVKPKYFGTAEKVNLYDLQYENWIRSLPCTICEPIMTLDHLQLGRPQISEIHHNWKERENSFLGMPLCNRHHTSGNDAYHKLEHVHFQNKHNVVIGWVLINLMSFYSAYVCRSGGKIE